MPPDILPGDGASLAVPLIVLICALVQSLAGVGLLLFGTPTLLLLGIGFGETLAVLLPCSVTVTSASCTPGCHGTGGPWHASHDSRCR